MMAIPVISGLASHIAVEAVARHAASALISSVWEGLLLVAATAALLRVVPGTTARLRFGIWTTVFFLLAGLPVVSAVLAVPAAGGAVAATPLRVDPRWSYALAELWMATVALRLVHLGVQAARLRRLWRSAVPVAKEALLGVDVPLGKVQICTSEELDRPSVIGFLAPRILIPVWLFGELSAVELKQIVLHEMEHLRRRDDWMNLVQKVGLALFPLNPALFWIDRRLATERELACDDGVLSTTHAPRAYATCLTSLAERRIARRMARRGNGRLTALALGALGVIRRSEFSRRIESILSRRPGLSPAMGRAFAAMFAAGALVAAGAMAHAPALVAFETGVQPELAQAALPSPRILAARSVGTAKIGSARLEDAVYHPPAVAAKPVAARQTTKSSLKAKGRALAVAIPEPERRDVVIDPAAQFLQVAEQAKEQQRRLMLLTDWQDSVPVPAVVKLPDGRIIFLNYTVTPTQAGWIVFQL